MDSDSQLQPLRLIVTDMVEVLLVLEIFLTENAKVEDLLCGTPSCSEACLFFGDDLLRLWLRQGLACSFVGNHEEVQHHHKPYPSHQKPL